MKLPGANDGIINGFPTENGSLPDLMMGVETTLPLFAMDAAAQKGRPAAASITGFLLKPYLPRSAPRGALRWGVLI